MRDRDWEIEIENEKKRIEWEREWEIEKEGEREIWGYFKFVIFKLIFVRDR